ncbi:unnamed protein product, partial [Urochloa humidicola]
RSSRHWQLPRLPQIAAMRVLIPESQHRAHSFAPNLIRILCLSLSPQPSQSGLHYPHLLLAFQFLHHCVQQASRGAPTDPLVQIHEMPPRSKKKMEGPCSIRGGEPLLFHGLESAWPAPLRSEIAHTKTEDYPSTSFEFQELLGWLLGGKISLS